MSAMVKNKIKTTKRKDIRFVICKLGEKSHNLLETWEDLFVLMVTNSQKQNYL